MLWPGQYLCAGRSLFAKDKLLFSFLMCVKVLEVNPVELRFFMTGGVDAGQEVPPPPPGPLVLLY